MATAHASGEVGAPAPWSLEHHRPDGAEALVAAARLTLASCGPVPRPGGGRTAARWQVLADVGAHDLSLARIVEGDLDARAILAELGAPPSPPDVLLGVWAARPDELEARPDAGGWALSGAKPFCSGAGLLDGALLTAMTPGGPRLFRIGAEGTPSPGTWGPIGMRATRSEVVRFEAVHLPAEAAIGPVGAYVSRPGFWHGGAGVAACWFGGASALLEDLRDVARARPDPVRLATYGHAALALRASAGHLRATATAIDAAPHDLGEARRSAVVCRAAVASACRAVLAACTSTLGTSGMATPRPAQRVADLEVYLTQFDEGVWPDVGAALLDAPPERLA